MKTTIELPDALFSSAKALASTRHTTLRALVEDGLRRVLADSQTKAPTAFKLCDARVRGQSMHVADPRQWHQMEEEHELQRLAKPQT